MTKAESYTQEYGKINHAYNQIFDSFEVLQQAEDADQDMLRCLNDILVDFSNLLDVIKEERGTAPGQNSADASQKTGAAPSGWSVH